MFIIASTSYKSVQCALLPIVLIELKVGGAETELVHLSTRPIVMQNVQRFPFSFEDDPHFFTFIGAPILIVFTPVLWQLSVLAKKSFETVCSFGQVGQEFCWCARPGHRAQCPSN